MHLPDTYERTSSNSGSVSSTKIKRYILSTCNNSTRGQGVNGTSCHWRLRSNARTQQIQGLVVYLGLVADAEECMQSRADGDATTVGNVHMVSNG